MKFYVSLSILVACLFTGSQLALADVVWKHLSDENVFVKVRNDEWQPEGFENGITVPAPHVMKSPVTLDGRNTEGEWNDVDPVTVPLAYGSVVEATVRALYTDEDVYLQVRWPDPTENREHHPWVWDVNEQGYVSSPRAEDSIFISFEGGCEWAPSLLQGYVYDFDGWHWLAARSDPVGQAWDMDGTIQDQMIPGLNFDAYPARKSGMDWNVKFVDRHERTILHDDWDELKRFYFYRRAGDTVYIRAEPDGSGARNLAEQLPPPAAPPADETQTYPQYKAVRLEGDAGEVSAKGQWADGYWTVEFRRSLVTPADTTTDWVFTRLSQFSLHVFDGVDRFDQTSESPRLFLRFLAPEKMLVKK